MLPAPAHPVVWTAPREAAWREAGARPAVAVWTAGQTARFLAAIRREPLYPCYQLMARARSALRVAPRASAEVSIPVLASPDAMKPPIAPAPTTQMRMNIYPNASGSLELPRTDSPGRASIRTAARPRGQAV